ncbi:hypothetical protein K469DRAFT_552326 [Zopfia rhizophila CBS 207.26]|uniref:Uncharacterized protein n=1 Tax=Zopfia rhizophila CBS 207.26 TaxID=1314779 RepID=A0A6A6EPK7_9PEZI|nr:hypothetical protein K469DRAFT_552326 [Zopfia rhizophila CBS 207.26]
MDVHVDSDSGAQLVRRRHRPVLIPEKLPKLKEASDSLAQARALKAKLETSGTALKSAKKSVSRKKVEEDPENHIIKTLRTEHQMEWGAIANYLNEERIKRGEPPSMTQPAVYSRFVRNAPRIARANGEVGFDPKDYMYIRHPHHYPFAAGGNISPFQAGPTPRRETPDPAESFSVRRDFVTGNVRKKSKLATDCSELETAVKSNLLVEAVQTVDRNFWTFVADELERTSGKMYDPKALESRYKSL